MAIASARLLEERGVDYRLIELSDRAVTVEDVIRYSKTEIDPGEICKTIVVKDVRGAKKALFLLGEHRIDFRKLRKVMGKASIASPGEVEEATGVKPGAVCPLTLSIPVYVDERVFERGRINFGSGDHLYGIEMSPSDLGKVLVYKVVDAVKV